MTKNAPDANESLLEECVVELRRLYDYGSESLEHVRNKALALMVGEVAIVTFLFSRDGNNSLLKHGTPVYGYVALGLGVAFLAYAFYKYFRVIETIQWQFPTEDYDMKNPTARFHSSRLEFLDYLHSEYMRKIPDCLNKIRERSVCFMHGTYALSAGVLIIILVKYGGGA